MRVDSTDARGASKMTLGLSNRNVETQCHSTFFLGYSIALIREVAGLWASKKEQHRQGGSTENRTNVILTSLAGH